MENASKALIMAGSVLIGILVLSLAVYLFVSFGSTASEVHKQNAEQQIEQFNAQFTSYVGKEDITIYDVVTVANLATDNNIYYEFPKRPTAPTKNPNDADDNYISVFRGNTSIEKGYNMETTDYNQLIKGDLRGNGELPQYECEVKISAITKRVYLIKFQQK